jgi:tRNA(His) 5'-end guanylyltransferase
VKDELGDFFKKIEDQYKYYFSNRDNYLIIRLDGRGFSQYTKNLIRPYDSVFSKCMIDTTLDLCKETNAILGYTQSDEISLLLKRDESQQFYFNGNRDKIISCLSSFCSINFYKKTLRYLPEKSADNPNFDCRAFSTHQENISDYFKWRQKDAMRNSVTGLYLYYFSHIEALNKSTEQKIAELFLKNIDWTAQPSFFKFGTYLKKEVVDFEKKYSPEEIALLPKEHDYFKGKIIKKVSQYKVFNNYAEVVKNV